MARSMHSQNTLQDFVSIKTENVINHYIKTCEHFRNVITFFKLLSSRVESIRKLKFSQTGFTRPCFSNNKYKSVIFCLLEIFGNNPHVILNIFHY
ncbi:Uncharacterised protein [Klebsiella pneumoniae]|nr:Uncharacterised protein [Klebsiella pneumoniae]